MRRYPSLAEYRGRYNVAESELYPGETVHNSEPNVPPLADDAHEIVCDELVAATSKHGLCNPAEWDGEPNDPPDHYWVHSDNWYGERTIHLFLYGNAELTESLIKDLQAVLQRHPLWRIYVVGGSTPEGEYVAMIYPTEVRYD